MSVLLYVVTMPMSFFIFHLPMHISEFHQQREGEDVRSHDSATSEDKSINVVGDNGINATRMTHGSKLSFGLT
jgi:hypothetical protein